MAVPAQLQSKYESIAKKVIMEILNVPSIITSHNKSGNEAEFTEVIDASDVGNLKTLFGAKTAWGTRLTVAVKSKRNVIIDKIAREMESKKARIRDLYIEALSETELYGDVPEDFEIAVDKAFSQGSETIRLLIKRHTLDKKTSEPKYAANPDYALAIFS